MTRICEHRTLVLSFYCSQVPDPNSYGSHPIYLEHRYNENTKTSRSHGVFLFRFDAIRIVIGESRLTSPPALRALTPSSSHLHLSAHTHAYLDRSSLPSLPSGIDTSDLTISDLDHCLVNLLPAVSDRQVQACTFTALHVRNLKDTVLVLPVVNGSALLHDLTRCTVVLGCHQVSCSCFVRYSVLALVQSRTARITA